MRILSNLLGMFLISRKLGMFGPILPRYYGQWYGGDSGSFNMQEIKAARRRNWRQSRGHRQ